MRHWIKGLVLVIAALLLIAGALFFVFSRGPRFEVKMADGSTLRVEKIHYGKRDAFLPGGWWQRVKENVAKRLPKKWADRLVKPPGPGSSQWSGASGPVSQAYSTNSDALHIWFMRLSPDGTGYQNVGIVSGDLVDQDGCVYAYSQAGGEDRGLLPSAASVAGGLIGGSGVVRANPAARGGGGSVQVITPGAPGGGVLSYSFTNNLAPAPVARGGGGGGWSGAPGGVPGGVTSYSFSNSPPPAMRSGGGGGRSVSSVVATGGPAGITFARGSGPQSSVSWLTFVSFPRFDKMLHLRVYDFQHALLGEFDLPNPAVLPNRPPPNWTAAKMPVTKTEGNLSFTLSDLIIKTNRYRGAQGGTGQEEAKEIVPQFEVREQGSLVDSWSAVDMDLVGASGNIASKGVPPALYLCPREPAWKLSVKFAGSEVSSLASNATWAVKELSIPSEGQWTAWTDTHGLQGAVVGLVAFAGPGVMVYSNNLPISGSTPDGGRLGLSISNAPAVFRGPLGSGGFGSSGGGSGTFGGGRGGGSGFGGGGFVPGIATATVRAPTPSIALMLTGLKDDQRFTVRAIDDQGHETYGQEISAGSWNARATGPVPYLKANPRGGLTYVTLNLAPDAKKVDLIFCIHNLRTEDFIFKPPGNN